MTGEPRTPRFQPSRGASQRMEHMDKSAAVDIKRASKNGKTAKGDLATPTDLSDKDTKAVAGAINKLVADAYALYIKTKNFHWHISGPNFRDYHLMLDEHADQIFATIDPLAERVRKLGQRTIHSLSEIVALTSIEENNDSFVPAERMIEELIADNRAMAKAMREAHGVCDDADDVATASLLEVYIDETERRIWFLFESSRPAGPHGQ